MLRPNYNRRLGFYRVGDQEFETKVQAIMACGPGQHPEFVFNDHAFGQVPWHIEPQQDLAQLYAQRARQLREKYDYLILSYSGGSDSRTALESFLANGIRLDEVLVRFPVELTKNRQLDANDFSPENLWAEYYLTTLPDLQWLAQHHPEIKLTVWDWSDKIHESDFFTDGWQAERSALFGPSLARRNRIAGISDSFDRHSNIGFMIAIDKPRILIQNDRYYLYFPDFVHRQNADGEAYELANFTTEFFYWSPDSADILRKQAHLIKRWFESNPTFKPYIQAPITNPMFRHFYEAITRPIVYPTWDLRKFQATKPSHMATYNFDWIVMEDRHFQHWQGGLNELYTAIDARFIDGATVTIMHSQYYEI